jgi:hypothetical protein
MSMVESLEWLAEANPEAIILDDCEDAFIGTTEYKGAPPVAVYDYEKLIDIHMKNGMEYEVAMDFVEYNTMRAIPYMGEHQPIVVR